jgi:tRNA(Ile)-lysidine synthase
MAKAHQALAIALGHTADDQAETLVARMFTGSGPTGMAGMRPNNGLLWRPLLGVRRQEVRDYLASLGQEWLSDPTNQELGPLRNRIRHKVLPLVEDMINPRTIEALGRLAGLSAEEEDHWQKWAQRVLQDRGSREGTSITLSNEWLKKAPLAERRRLLRYMAGVITQKGQHLLASHVDQLLDLAQGRSGRQLTLPGGIWAAKESQVLRMDQSSRPPDFRVFLQGPACVWLPHIGKVLMVDKVAEPKELQARGPAAWLPEGRVKWPLIVRPPLPGERFRPMGAPGSKLLSRVFIDLKVSLWWRRRTVVVADSRGAWWAGPWTVSERARKKVGESGWLGLRLIDT